MADIANSVFTILRGVSASLTDVIDNVNNDEAVINELQLSLLPGWQLFDKVLQINDETSHFKNNKTILIQLLYDAEDKLDEQNLNMLRQLGRAVSRTLGLSIDKAKVLVIKLNDSFKLWNSFFEVVRENNQIQLLTPPRYIHLDSDTRRRVAYFSMFPEDHQFKIDDLVHLWIGECFVQLDGERLTLREIEERHVNKLIEDSILQPLEHSKYTFNKAYRFYAKLASADTCLHLDPGLRFVLNDKIRHLSLSCDLNDTVRSKLEKIKLKLRTLLLSLGVSSETSDKDKVADVKKNLMKIQKRLKRLRVLSLRHTSVQDLPSFISKLQHLRYLDVSFTPLKTLPSDLYALQILKIKRIEDHLKRFPKDFTELTNLIYVDWDESFLRKHKQPCHMGKLSRLENLPLFQIGQTDGYRISELETMNFLQGSICIENLHHVNDENEAKDAKLDLKCGLTKIQLKWIRGSIEGCAYDEVLRGLRPHENVTELVITYYRGNDLPGWISDCKLQKVHLMECSSCYFPALGKMKNLKTLVLQNMESISQVSCRSDDDTDPKVVRFPLLYSMELYNMTQLQEWTGLLENDRPNLRKIKVDNCPLCEQGICNAFPEVINHQGLIYL